MLYMYDSTCSWASSSEPATTPLSMGRSSMSIETIKSLILSPPNIRKRLSSRLRKNRVDPGSPCLALRPRSWLSMRLESCLSVPMTCSPPSATTSSFSALVITLYSPSIWLKLSLILMRTGSSSGPFSKASLSLVSASSSVCDSGPQTWTAMSLVSCSCCSADGERSQGNRDSVLTLQESLVSGRTRSTPSSRLTIAGISTSFTLILAMLSAFPPRRISVPLPAMFVAIVTAPFLPLWATISDSLSMFSGLALRTSCLTPICCSSWDRPSLDWTDVVPMRIGLPDLCSVAISLATAFHL
mmetsp:Transcript_12226/g.22251  ORF Transcript_12226/g.22251 Transcript_12226/m.22251 type:complete len:299 (-) Transcript_12226:1051-1947(-)